MKDRFEFQSTHPRRVRHVNGNPTSWTGKFQSTHPRRVRPDSLEWLIRETWFQSTHPRRVRLMLRTRKTLNISFNPRTHVGCDIASFISRIFVKRFNPRTHVGCDRLRRILVWIQMMFQSTHPRRVRLGFRSAKSVASSFNPRTHVGCDFACQLNPIRV